MNNITLRELENERKHKIANLSKDEASNYIDSLNERIAAAMGGINNGFYTDVEEIKKNTDLCYEVGELLTRTYPNIREVIAASRNNILLKKYGGYTSYVPLYIIVYYLKFINFNRQIINHVN